MSIAADRRGFLGGGALTLTGAALTGAALTGVVATSAEAVPMNLAPAGSASLKALHAALAKAPRRRDFKRVEMILTDPSDWDAEALGLLKAYRAGPKQVWDMVDVEGPWLNLMRNTLNVQVFSFKHHDFLAVAATHASANWALYDDMIWEKYQLGTRLKNKPSTQGNPYITLPAAASASPADVEGVKGVYSPAANGIATLQRRGAVFIACHNAIWEFTKMLVEKGVNPDHLSHEEMAAELTNHLIPDVILNPGTVGTILELQGAGFHYIK